MIRAFNNYLDKMRRVGGLRSKEVNGSKTFHFEVGIRRVDTDTVTNFVGAFNLNSSHANSPSE